MATVDQLVENIQEVIQDPTYDEDYIVDRMNRVYANIAGGIKLPEKAWGSQVSPPLPDLLVIDNTLWSSPSLAYITMPATFQRRVDFLALVSTKQRIEILNTFVALRKRYPMLDATSQIQVAAVSGRRLHYQGKPSYTVTTSSTIGFTAATRTITDTGLGLDVSPNMVINISGSVANDGDKTVVSVAANHGSCVVSEILVQGAVGPSIVVTKGVNLSTHYYKYPETLALGGPGPLALSEHQHDDLIVNGVATYIYNLIEDGVEDPKTNTKKYGELFIEAVESMSMAIPAEGESMFIWPDEGQSAY